MFSMFQTAANELVEAYKDVANELGKDPAFGSSSSSDGQTLTFRERLILCGFPGPAVEAYKPDRSLRPFPNPGVLRSSLVNRFPHHEFVVWNLSGNRYSYEDLFSRIIEYDFPSRPIPPFAALLELAGAIHAWLESDDNNVAVVHDLSGRRAAIVVACALELSKTLPPRQALDAVTKKMGRPGSALVASQLRYFDYFCALHDKTLPYWKSFDDKKQLRIQRIIVNGVPDFAHETKLSPNRDTASCSPYFEAYDGAGNILGSTKPLSPVFGRDVSFSLVPSTPLTLMGDVMLRFFHHRLGEESFPMFAVAFHTGFVSDIVLRFMFHEIDGAAKNPRFPKDMFVDVILFPDLEHDVVKAGETVMNKQGEDFEISDNDVDDEDVIENDMEKSFKTKAAVTINDDSLPESKPASMRMAAAPSPGMESVASSVGQTLREIDDLLGDDDLNVEDDSSRTYDDLSNLEEELRGL